MEARKTDRKYTYQDYLTWDDTRRWELFYGVPYELVFGEDPHNMSPAPNRKHQQISRNLFVLIANYLTDKSCEVYSAPFDIRLSEAKDATTLVQPDISVFCDLAKLDDLGAKGAPDWIIEILSPSTTKRDLSLKLTLYQEFGVKEYWIADPDKNSILIYTLKPDGKYRYQQEAYEGKITPQMFPDLVIDLVKVFE